MNGLMLRRQAMMAVKPVETWDFEWDYTMGKLEDQTGWGTDKSGSGTSAIIADGEKIYTGGNSYYQIYIGSDGSLASLRNFTSGYGVMEVVMRGKYNSAKTNLRITAAVSSTKRVTLFQHNGEWRVMDHQQIADCTPIADAANDTEYKVRIELKDTVADIYLNDVLIKADQDTSATLYGTSNCIMHQNGNDNTGTNYYVVVKSLKIKQGL